MLFYENASTQIKESAIPCLDTIFYRHSGRLNDDDTGLCGRFIRVY